jgi:hypothetical protein
LLRAPNDCENWGLCKLDHDLGKREFSSTIRGFGRQPPPRPPRRTIPVAAVLIGGPLMMLALVILGIAVGTMIAVLF